MNNLTEARAKIVKEVDAMTGHYEEAMEEVEEMKGKLSESSFEMTPADILNARAQGLTDDMFKTRTKVILQIFTGKDLTLAATPMDPSKSVLDNWERRCLHPQHPFPHHAHPQPPPLPIAQDCRAAVD